MLRAISQKCDTGKNAKVIEPMPYKWLDELHKMFINYLAIGVFKVFHLESNNYSTVLFYKHFKGTRKKEIYFKKINGLRFRSKSHNDLCLSLICSMKKAALRISTSSWDALTPSLSAGIQAGLAMED